ncbi:MAG TPA: fibronectin type III domain-containing protein [Thermoplasmata archaeon]|nr:fibronectin type III domain-containing protein [Thermoplasmata archaeon]
MIGPPMVAPLPTRGRGHPVRPWLALGIVLALLGLTPILGGGPGTVGPPVRPPPVLIGTVGHVAVHPFTPRGPTEGRLFNTSLSPVAGVAVSNELAVDILRQVAYSLNRPSATLDEFNLISGASLAAAQLENPVEYLPRSLAFDPVHQRLFVSVASTVNATAWITVLDALTLAPVANITTFGSDPTFHPEALLFDPTSQQLLAENATNLDTAVINTTLEQVRSLVSFPSCAACLPTGFVDLAGHDLVLLPGAASTIPALNTSTAAAAPAFLSPDLEFRAGVGAYDNRTGQVWLANDSTTGDLEIFSSAGTWVNSLPGPASPTALGYVWNGDLVAVADANATYPGAGWEVTTYSGAGLFRTGVYNNPGLPRWETGYAFTGLYPDVAINATYLLTAGGGNATVSLRVNTTAATLSLYRIYPGYPDARAAILADPANGRYYAIDGSPAGIVGYSMNSQAILWQIDLTYAAATYSAPVVSIDPTQQRLYVTFGAAFIDVYSTATGGYLATDFLPNPVDSLSVDSIHHLLYAGTTYPAGPNVTILSISANPNTVLSTIASVDPPCGVAALPALEEVAVASCNDTIGTSVTLYAAANGSILHRFTAGPLAASHLTVDSASDVYATSPSGNNVTVYRATNGTYGTNWTLGPGWDPAAAAVDPPDGFGLATSEDQPAVAVVDLANGSVVDRIPTPTPARGQPDFSLPSTTFYVPIYFTGQVLTVAVVPLPTPPGGLTASGGNGSISLTWASAVGTPGYPVTGYLVLQANSSTAPWVVASSTANLTVTLGSLANGNVYYVAVESVSAAGVSARTSEANATPLGVPYPPIGLTVSNASASGFLVSWAPPASTQGAPVVNYTVEYATRLGGPWSTASAGAGLSYNLTGLAPSTAYDLRVVAWNAAGEGHPSAVVSAATSVGPAATGGPRGLDVTSMTVVMAALLVGLVVATLVLVALVGRSRKAGPTAGPSPPPGAHQTVEGPATGSPSAVPSSTAPPTAGPVRPR